MIKCPKCNSDVKKGALFCTQCGIMLFNNTREPNKDNMRDNINTDINNLHNLEQSADKQERNTYNKKTKALYIYILVSLVVLGIGLSSLLIYIIPSSQSEKNAFDKKITHEVDIKDINDDNGDFKCDETNINAETIPEFSNVYIHDEFTIGDLTYKAGHDYFAVVKCNNPNVTSVNIEPYIKANGDVFPVAVINNYTFSNCENLQYVEIPNSITSIGRNVFYNCKSLKRIQLPTSIKFIDEYTFSKCNNLESIEIPYNVIFIGNHAFENCQNLAEVILPNSVTEIGEYAFSNCESLAHIQLSDNLQTIGQMAFYACSNLNEIHIPESVTKIGQEAFRESGLYTIEIPASVEELHAWVFYKCPNLSSIQVNENNKYYSSYNGVLFNKDLTLLLQYPIGNEQEKYIIPQSVQKLFDDSFSGSRNLRQIDIPSCCVKDNESKVFQECENITIKYY